MQPGLGILTQEGMPTVRQLAQMGSTAVKCWALGIQSGQDSLVPALVELKAQRGAGVQVTLVPALALPLMVLSSWVIYPLPSWALGFLSNEVTARMISSPTHSPPAPHYSDTTSIYVCFFFLSFCDFVVKYT